jgi:cell division protein FtsW (lipid II flippase)
MRVVSTASTPASRARRHLRIHNLELAGLALASLVVVAGTLLAYAGQVWPLGDLEAQRASGALVHVNAVRAPRDLLTALEAAFPTPADRELAAREMHRFLGSGRIGHVGALAAARIDQAEIERTPGLDTFRQRLAERRGRPGGIPLFTGAQLADLKPRLVVRDVGQFRRRLVLAMLLLVASFHAVHAVRRRRGLDGDAVLLPAVHLLTGIGFLAMIGLRDPVRDTTAFLPFAQGVAAGCAIALLIMQVDFEKAELRNYFVLPLTAALLLSVLLLLAGTGPGTSDAKVNLWGVQPVEVVRLLVALALASYFARRWELLRELAEPADRLPPWLRWLKPPRRTDVGPLAASLALIVGFFFLQKDLGPALVIGALFLTLYGVARARIALVLAAVAVLVAAFWVGYELGVPRTVAQRVDMWLSPWESGQPGGDQIAHALWALATGGISGAGPGLGDPQVIPAGHTDLVLAAVGEELGLLGVAAVLLLLALVTARALWIALHAPGDYTLFLVLGVTITLAAQALLITAGLLALLPLSGVVTPFLSYGRSSMIVNCAAIGIVLAVAERARDRPAREPFRRPLRWLALVLAAGFSILLARALWIQAVRADRTMTAASLTRQADGARRYSYNPRLLAAARQIVRGTIYDRRGIPLATSRPSDLAKHRAWLESAGALARCGPDDSRCYPLGGLLFHVLGDWNTQRNWAATNTSFVERDADPTLRGYDDRATVVGVRDPASGELSRTIRRDYRALVPLVRHRHQPKHPAVRALLETARDVKTTIDARLQLRVARALERRIRAGRHERGAAIVLDAATGELLASVSYPWPEPGDADQGAAPREEALLDRARYGLYPPGSTFKIVTAIAALRRDPRLADAQFVCRRLPDGRVGSQIPGVPRPVRDDVLDRTPHGALRMEEAIVHSCNAYFAQLGLRVGAEALLDAAALFQIPAAQPATPARLRASLPHAAYGQGQVLATPLRMASVAASVARGGTGRPPSWILEPKPAAPDALDVLEPRLARSLAGAMRRVVTQGTGRALADAAVPVAGKTGTAELDTAASHSWFIGFAPYGSRGRTIAFAVIVEHAGYGARAAAPVAGDIVRAAREIGMLGSGETATTDGGGAR